MRTNTTFWIGSQHLLARNRSNQLLNTHRRVVQHARASQCGAVWRRRYSIATRTESARNFFLKQPKKAFASSYGNFENSKARGGIHYDCRPCRPKHVGRVLWANARTYKKPLAFENGREARETPEKRSSARTRAKLEGVCATKFLISVVNNLG